MAYWILYSTWLGSICQCIWYITPYVQWNNIRNNRGFGHNICSKQSMPRISWSPPNTNWWNQQRGPKVCPSDFKFLLCRVVHLPWGRSAQMCCWQKSSAVVRRTMKGQFWVWTPITCLKMSAAAVQMSQLTWSTPWVWCTLYSTSQSIILVPKTKKGREWKV